jgi:diacylglycerol kinase family enzyme
LNSNPFQADLKIDGTESNISDECWMIAIANGKSEGGRYQISPQSLNYDGKVEVIVVKAISRIRLIGAFIRLSFGFSFSDSLVEKFQFIESCEVKTEIQLKQHADGEQISDGTEISFRLIKSAVSVVVAP